MSNKRCIQIVVHGKVQGVYFRKFTQQMALSLDISGFVRNQKDGSVYIEARGRESQILKFIQWCNKGPQLASVERVEIADISHKTYYGFEIRKTE